MDWPFGGLDPDIVAGSVRDITDGLSWERSQSVYAAVPGSAISRFLTNDEAQESAQRTLKKAVAD